MLCVGGQKKAIFNSDRSIPLVQVFQYNHHHNTHLKRKKKKRFPFLLTPAEKEREKKKKKMKRMVKRISFGPLRRLRDPCPRISELTLRQNEKNSSSVSDSITSPHTNGRFRVCDFHCTEFAGVTWACQDKLCRFSPVFPRVDSLG